MSSARGNWELVNKDMSVSIAQIVHSFGHELSSWKLGACKQDMSVSIAQIVHNFGHELSSWNQELTNSIVPGLQC